MEYLNIVLDYFQNFTLPDLNSIVQIFFKIVLPPLLSLIGIFKLTRNHLKRKANLFDDLHPNYSSYEIDNAIKYYIPTYGTTQIPSYKEEPYRPDFIEKLIPLYLRRFNKINQNKTNFFFILGDIGFGKTTLLINLYYRYKYKFWMRPKFDIILLYLGKNDTLELIKKIEHRDKIKTILLLDAFDEDYKAVKDYKSRLAEIINEVADFKAVVISCRTQFFNSEEEEPSATNIYSPAARDKMICFERNYITCFSKFDIATFLIRKFNFCFVPNMFKLYKAYNCIKNCHSLMVRPMLLSHIGELIKGKGAYNYNYEVYQALLDFWIERESKKPEILKRYRNPENFKGKMIEFSDRLAITIFNKHLRGGGLCISKDENILNSELQLSDIEILYVNNNEKRNNSFLVRDAFGNYKFSHKSILEFLFARHQFINRSKLNTLEFLKIEGCNRFYSEMLFDQVFVPYFNEAKGIFISKGESNYKLINKINFEQFLSLDSIILNKLNKDKLVDLKKLIPSVDIIILANDQYDIIKKLYSFYISIALNCVMINRLNSIIREYLTISSIYKISLPCLENCFSGELRKFIKLSNLKFRLYNLKDQLTFAVTPKIFTDLCDDFFKNYEFNEENSMLCEINNLMHLRDLSEVESETEIKRLENFCTDIVKEQGEIYGYLRANVNTSYSYSDANISCSKKINYDCRFLIKNVESLINAEKYSDKLNIVSSITKTTNNAFLVANLSYDRISRIIPKQETEFKNQNEIFYHTFITGVIGRELTEFMKCFSSLCRHTISDIHNFLRIKRKIKYENDNTLSILVNPSCKDIKF